jgi:4-amino-4-deoxy-L-arabinose transferase-like glycosyltransferase
MKSIITSEKFILIFIILLSVLLRTSNITFDLPQGRGLEHLEIMRALELGMGKFNFERITKGGLFYVLFAEYGVLYIILSIFGIVKSSQEFALYYMNNPSIFWIIGRLTSAIMGTVSVVILYFLGKKLYDYKTGFIASFLFAIYPIHVKFSHIVCVDIPMVMFTLASFYFIVLLHENGLMKNYIMAGLFIGLAVMNKFPAIVLLCPLMLAHYWRQRAEPGGSVRWMERRLLVSLGVMGLIYLAGTPGLVAYPGKVVGIIAQISQGKTQFAAYSGKTPVLWRVYLNHFFETLGMPLLLFFGWGIFRAVLKGTAPERCMAVFCLLFYIGLSTSGFREWSNHYTLHIVPFGLLLASRALFATGVFL